MKRFSYIAVLMVALFSFTSVLYSEQKSETDIVLDNFFSIIKQIDLKQMEVNTMEADVSVEIKLSPMLEPYLKPFFSEGVPHILKSKGYIRNVFKNVGDKYEVDYSYIYQNTSMGDIVFSRIQDKIEILLPSLGIIVNDTIPEIKAVVNQYIPLTDQPSSPLETTKLVLMYLKTQEKAVKEKIKFEKTGNKNGVKIYVYSYPVDNGKILVEIYDQIWTFASISFDGISNTASVYFQINYPLIKDAITSNFLPQSIVLKGSKEDTDVSIILSNIKYNQLLSATDFEITRMNFQEFIVSMYLKYLQKQKGGK
ncbi:MAG: hypothetical protein NC905_02650 [Candidatus Omnitrophica bacterium]|nr:hypothetical protein [Candidatus Omnitrophota bacterium]MCM8777151.1 hypothetical protein [Candidatus Omnitrophota bacterium]